MRYYDPQKNALVYICKSATPQMWDEHWSLGDEKTVLEAIAPRKSNFVVSITKKYLRRSSGLILEGGCGTGVHVAALNAAGYRSVGIDFAEKTVAMLKKAAPDLDIRLGDIRKLPLENRAVSAYWSLGVIEHFYFGYDQIVNEMARVIEPDGFLFITHPHISPLRRLKIYFRKYPVLSSIHEPKGFYQFALDYRKTVEKLKASGFHICKVSSQAGLKGFKDELPSVLKSPLQSLYDYKGSSMLIRGLRYVLDNLLAPLCGHSCLIICQNTNSKTNSPT